MSQMRKPVMEVIRFSAEDVIVASGGSSRRMSNPSFILTGAEKGGATGDGIASYNNTNYLLNSKAAVIDFIGAMGVSDAGISNGGDSQSLRGTLNIEATGVLKNSWNGTYTYDPNATWTNDKGREYNGVFFRQ